MIASARWRLLLPAILACQLAGLLLSAPMRAQGTADIPLDDNAYVYIDALLARGALRSLSSLERPYALAELRKALEHDSEMIDDSRALRGFARGLRRALRKYDAGSYEAAQHRPLQDSTHTPLVRYNVGADVYATGQTSTIREVMLDDETRAVYPGATLRVLGEAGPVSVVFRGVADGRLLRDPEFMIGDGPRDNARVDDGYIDARWPIAEVFVGREGRNWGPADGDGLLLGHYAYSYDHVYARLGPRAFHLQIIAARLNDIVLGGDTVAERYFTIHRLATRWHSFELALSESFIYGGPGQGFDLRYLNPLNILTLSQNNESAVQNAPYTTNGNKAYAFEMAWRTHSLGNAAFEGYLDDYQLHPTQSCQPICSKPTSFGATATIDGFPFLGAQRLFASYSIMSNLSYRNDNPYEGYEQWGLGLGQGYTDYDEIRAGVDLAVLPEVPLKVYGAYRRQGQGNYRITEPPADSLPLTPTIFSGVVSYIGRVGVTGAVTGPWVELSGDVGVNHATNYQNVAGISRWSVAGTIKLSLSVARLFGGTIHVPGD